MGDTATTDNIKNLRYMEKTVDEILKIEFTNKEDVEDAMRAVYHLQNIIIRNKMLK